MSDKIGNIVVVKVGKVSANDKLGENKPKFLSGIKKYPIKSAYISKTGFILDEQADKLHHGGETKAVLFFCVDTYEKINGLNNSDFKYNEVAHYGENLVVEGVNEATICIGDILRIGGATVEISQPRQPCWKLSANTKTKKMTSLIYNNGLTGWYARVVEDGEIAQGDEIFLTKRKYPNLTIEALNKIIVNPLSNIKLTKEALACDILGAEFKASLDGRAKLKDPLNEPFWYHKEPEEN